MKNFLLYNKPEIVADKPVFLVSVTSSFGGGSYPLAEMRMTASKNTQLCFIPEQLCVRSVNHVMNGSECENEIDNSLRERLDYGINVFLKYCEALRIVRDADIRDFTRYPFGL